MDATLSLIKSLQMIGRVFIMLFLTVGVVIITTLLGSLISAELSETV